MREIFEKYQMYILIAAAVWIVTVSVAAFSDSVVLDSGQVIEVPEGGSICQYHATYCPTGWQEDGTYPFIAWKDAIQALIDGALPYPMCDDGDYSFGGPQVKPCYRLEN